MADPSNLTIHLVIARAAHSKELQIRVIVLMKGEFLGILVKDHARFLLGK